MGVQPIGAGSGPEEAGKGEAILRAAMKVFSDKGFSGARIEEIARRASVGKGTVYEYFNSKDDLFEQVILRSLETLVQLVKEGLDAGSSLTGSLERAFANVFRLVDENQALAQVLMHNPTGGPGPDLRRAVKRMRQDAISDIKQVIGRYAGGTPDYDANLAAHIILGALQTLAFARFQKGDDALGGPIEDTARSVSQLLYRGLDPG